MVEVTSTRRDIHWIKGLVYGKAGVGKTTLLATAPNPIIISAEAGLLSLADRDIPVIEVTGIEDLRKALPLVEPYTTVCIDSLSEIAELSLNKFKVGEKDPRRAYMHMSDQMIALTRKFRDMPEKHVMFTAKEVAEKDEDTGIITYQPMMPGKAFPVQLPYFFDLVLAMRATNKGESYLQTYPDIRYVAKDRSGKLDRQEQPNLTNIFNKMTGQ